jgi:hypothetical protein
MVEGPKAMFNAARNRIAYGEKPEGMKKGGKVAGRLATRGYGIAKK